MTRKQMYIDIYILTLSDLNIELKKNFEFCCIQFQSLLKRCFKFERFYQFDFKLMNVHKRSLIKTRQSLFIREIKENTRLRVLTSCEYLKLKKLSIFMTLSFSTKSNSKFALKSKKYKESRKEIEIEISIKERKSCFWRSKIIRCCL